MTYLLQYRQHLLVISNASERGFQWFQGTYLPLTVRIVLVNDAEKFKMYWLSYIQ